MPRSILMLMFASLLANINLAWAEEKKKVEIVPSVLSSRSGDGLAAMAPDGRTAIALAADSKILIVWEVRSGRALRTLNGHSDFVRSIAYSPDSRTALSGSYDKTMKLWNLETGDVIQTFTDDAEISFVAFSPNGQST